MKRIIEFSRANINFSSGRKNINLNFLKLYILKFIYDFKTIYILKFIGNILVTFN